MKPLGITAHRAVSFLFVFCFFNFFPWEVGFAFADTGLKGPSEGLPLDDVPSWQHSYPARRTRTLDVMAHAAPRTTTPRLFALIHRHLFRLRKQELPCGFLFVLFCFHV